VAVDSRMYISCRRLRVPATGRESQLSPRPVRSADRPLGPVPRRSWDCSRRRRKLARQPNLGLPDVSVPCGSSPPISPCRSSIARRAGWPCHTACGHGVPLDRLLGEGRLVVRRRACRTRVRLSGWPFAAVGRSPTRSLRSAAAAARRRLEDQQEGESGKRHISIGHFMLIPWNLIGSATPRQRSPRRAGWRYLNTQTAAGGERCRRASIVRMPGIPAPPNPGRPSKTPKYRPSSGRPSWALGLYS
jgi:hypothetical protein